MKQLQNTIEQAMANPSYADEQPVRNAVDTVIAALDRGEIRVAEKVDGIWVVHAWVKQAILLYFRHRPLEVMGDGFYRWHDKIPIKQDFAAAGVRAVPPATARFGSFVERGAILMPSYVNIGARVGSGTMVDTWATVGSCAQVGRNVHLSGGVGIGGVLEPPSAVPVIVEDGVFVGSRCILVEGVVIEEEAVLGANVTLTASTPILDVTGSEPVELRGRVPARSVVIPEQGRNGFPPASFLFPVR